VIREGYTIERIRGEESKDAPRLNGETNAEESLKTTRAQDDTHPKLIWWGDVPLPPPPQLVQDTLPETGLAILGGQFGFAKTFVAADLASAVIVGGEFAGKTVKRRGGVLWLAAEGETEIEGRVRAAVAARGGNAEERQPFARQARTVPLLKGKEALEQLRALAKEADEFMRANFNAQLALIVIDTLSAAADFDDENSAAETQKVMNKLRELARETGALVLVIDHHGKLPETGIRGSSAKSAAADAILACLGDRNQTTGAVGNRQMAVVKLRAGPTGRVVPFELEAAEDASTRVVRWREETQAEQTTTKAKPWPKALNIFKRALDEAIDSAGKPMTPRAGMPEVRAVDRETVRTEFFRRYPADNAKSKGEAFRRCEKDAVVRGILCSLSIGPDMAQTIFWLK
jgi:AAA domain